MRPRTLTSSYLRDATVERLVDDLEERIAELMRPRRLLTDMEHATDNDWITLAATVVRLARERDRQPEDES